MNLKDIYALLHEIEQCASSADSAYSLANEIGSEAVAEVQAGLETVSLELAELKRRLRGMIGGTT